MATGAAHCGWRPTSGRCGRTQDGMIAGEFFRERSFERSAHPHQGMLTQLLCYRVGQLGVETGIPDAVRLVFEFGNPGHRFPASVSDEFSPIVYQGMAQTG